MTTATKPMHQVPGLTILACGCRAQQQEPYDRHPLRLIYVEHCPLHAAAPEMVEMLKWLYDTISDPSTPVYDERVGDTIGKLLARIDGSGT